MVKMGLPVRRIDAGVLDGVPAMDHHPVTDIDPTMTGSSCVISTLKENQISWPCVFRIDIGGHAPQPLRAEPSVVPTIPAVVHDPTDEAGAIKAGCRRRSAPYIGIAKILFRFTDHPGESFIGKRLRGNRIAVVWAITGQRVQIEEIVSVSKSPIQNIVPLNLICRHS